MAVAPNAGGNADLSKYYAEANKLKLNEVEQSRYYTAKAIEFILNNKIQAIKLYFLKVLNYFNYRNELGTKSEASSVKDFLMLITYSPLLLFFVMRFFLIKFFKPSSFEWLLITLYLSDALFSAIFYTRIRYRLPFYFLLIIIVAMFLHNILNIWLAKTDLFSEVPSNNNASTRRNVKKSL